MSLISFTPVTDGSTASASGVNTPLSTIYNDYNGGITDANIASAAAIATSKLALSSASTSYTPSWTNLTVGNGTATGTYFQVGKIVFGRVSIVFGSTTSISGAVSFSLPVTASSTTYPTAASPNIGTGTLLDSGTSTINALAVLATTTTIKVRYGTTQTDLGATAPFTWETNDTIFIQFIYEAA